MLVLAITTQIQVFIVIRKAYRAGTLQTKEFKDKYGTLIQDLNVSRPFAVYYHPFILMRWLLTVLTLIFLRDFYSLQLILLYMFSLYTQYLLIHLKPMQEMTENYLGLFNEFMVQFYIYLMIALTEYNGSNPFRPVFGLGLVTIILISLAVNILKFFI